jgi:hypothetical protein
VGSGQALGNWELHNARKLTTSEDKYPLWTTGPVSLPLPSDSEPIQYKYVRLWQDGGVEWEAEGNNRMVKDTVGENGFVVDDGQFGYIQDDCFMYVASPSAEPPGTCAPSAAGVKVAVLGDSVAAGQGAPCWKGWATHLAASLKQKYDYGFANVSGSGLDTDTALKEFNERVAAEKPTVVVLAFGLELQAVSQADDAKEVVARFCGKLDLLVQAALDSGIYPVLGGIYPHAACSHEKEWCLRHAEDAIRGFGLPVLEWFSSTSSDGRTWDVGTSFTAGQPNTEGHRRMAAAIDLEIFDPARVATLLAARTKSITAGEPRTCFADGNGFEFGYSDSRSELIVKNSTANEYQISASWAAMQDAMRTTKMTSPWTLRPGCYMAAAGSGGPASVTIGVGGRIQSDAKVPAGWSGTLRPVSKFLEDICDAKVLFSDGNLTVVYELSGNLVLVNQATCEYNVHPMWNDVRLATRRVPEGIYEDDSGCPFRTAVVSVHGLQSRVKVPAQGAIRLSFKGPLSSVPRVAVLPLGDRCSIRMLLHKVEYDGPCYPFDLTRTTSLAEVADMVGTGFTEMWNQGCLHWSEENGRVYHTRWGGLSFAHEVEPGEDPQNNFNPVADRMRKRYSGRSARFDYACKHADKVMFMRTGCASRDEVGNLLCRIQERYPGLDASLLLISDQPSEEFSNMLGVSHVREHFNPDRMYEDMGYWMDCANRFRDILHQHGINEKTLYWCPSNLKEADKELLEGSLATPMAKDQATRPKTNSEVRTLSHSKLYEVPPQGEVPTKVAEVPPTRDTMLAA